MKSRRSIVSVPLLAFSLVLLGECGCSSVPSNFLTTPKEVEINGSRYLACGDVVWIYSPSRGIADSSKKTYEITFDDEYGKAQDFKELTAYTIRDADDATYAMPNPAPRPDMTTHSGGYRFTNGEIVLFGNQGDAGRAKYLGPGNWKPVPCGL